jgi:hypothetical protein
LCKEAGKEAVRPPIRTSSDIRIVLKECGYNQWWSSAFIWNIDLRSMFSRAVNHVQIRLRRPIVDYVWSKLNPSNPKDYVTQMLIFNKILPSDIIS